MTKTRYPYIWAWGNKLGSFPYYIHDQQELAKKEGAPQDAIYRADEGWRTVRDVSDPMLVARLHKFAADLP